MKALASIAFATVFLSANTFAQKNVLLSAAAEGNLKGKVKSVRGSDYLEEYDVDGQLTSVTEFNSDGSVSIVEKYTYAKRHLLTEKVTYENSNELVERTTYEYDTNDFKIKSTNFDSEGKVTYQEIRKYVDNNHYILKKRFVGESGLYELETGDIQKSDTITDYETDTVTTDADNNIITEVVTTDGKTRAAFIKKVYSYKPGNRVPSLTQWFDETGKLTFESKSDFDSNGNMVSFIQKGTGPAKTTTYQYIYDDKGNYTKRIVSGFDERTEERAITYY